MRQGHIVELSCLKLSSVKASTLKLSAVFLRYLVYVKLFNVEFSVVLGQVSGAGVAVSSVSSVE